VTGGKPRVAITCGDPAGIGPEVIRLCLEAGVAADADLQVIGPLRWLDSLPGKERWTPVPVGPAGFEAKPGTPTKAGADVARLALDCAAAGCRDGLWDAVCTGPVSKEWMHKAGWRHPGQTEFFAARWGGRPVMAFCGANLRVVLATWHIPLRAVFEALDFEALEAAVAAAARLVDIHGGEGVQAPRIGVCGINPHAGEGGLLGNEEHARINPWLARLRARFPGVSACLPADTLFHRALRGDFDVVVALYHDQGLAPLKLVDFDTAVNVTLGLPWVRTSPDHGTAFDLAAKGSPSFSSMRHAIELAVRVARKRSAPVLRVV
jgi:4-hydroxythreonine-4-phosphate dehydrogenase